MKNNQDELRKKLKLKFNEQKKMNPNFSLRGLARNLGTSPATLSGFINGKRNLSSVIARKIASNLNLGEIEDTKSSGACFTTITEDRANVLSDWAYFAVLSLMETDDYISDVTWISNKMNLSEQKIRQVINDLVKYELVINTPEGFKPKDTECISSDDLQSKSLKLRHIENTLRAKNSIENDDLNLRDFSFLTLAIAKEDLKKYKKLIRRLQDDIVKIQSKSKKNAVYEFVFQVFPVSK